MVAPDRVWEAPDPVAAFFAAARSGRPVALPTSGTTGAARTVIRSPASWLDPAPILAERIELDARSRVWIPGPLTATMNLYAAVLARAAGARRVNSAAEATHLQLTPHQLAAVSDLAGRTVVVAGDRLARQRRQAAERAGARIHHYYGAAELSFVAWGTDADDLSAFPGVEIDLRDGVCWVRSAYLADDVSGPPGRWQRDGRGFATVGDSARWVGDCLRVTGRADTVITAGVTVLAGDVEQVLAAGLAGEVAVIGLDHGRLGQVVAAVLSDPGDRRQAQLSARALRPAERPRRWFVVPEWPSTPAGKLDRTALAAALAASPGRGMGGR